ncbi:hypothetical protein [Runella sp.]|uniref:hypothetical protein n=1 Tax=Runella sp. TaxID=1960881 RepID=UPI003D112AE4
MSLFQTISDGAVKASKSRKVITILLILLIVWLIRKEIRKVVQKSEYDALGTSANAQIAYKIRQACNPYGSVLGVSVIDGDGTDETTLFALAPLIYDWKGVQDSYFRLYNEQLVARLENELGTDLSRFLELMPKAGTVPTTPTDPIYYLGYNVRSKVALSTYKLDNPAQVSKTVSANVSLGQWAGEKTINNIVYVIIRRDVFWWTDFELVKKTDVTITKP